MKKRIVLVFGEMGSGKSYLARKMAEEQGLVFIEGDDLIPPDMRARVEKFLPPTPLQIEQLVATLQRLAYMSTATSKGRNGFVVAQALYRNKHREALIKFWEVDCAVECYWVRAGFWQNLKQLWDRPKGLKWVLYWLVSKPWFEAPTHAAVELRNQR